MTSLWFGAAALITLALAFIFIPYFIRLRRGELVREQVTIDIYKGQLKELDAEKAAGRLNEFDHSELSQEVKLNLLADTEEKKASTNHEGGRWLLPILAVIAIASSVWLYQDLGAQNDLAITQLLKRSTTEDYSKDDALELLQRLEVQVEKTPKDVEAWYLIGRINFDLGNFAQAVLGFNGVLQHLSSDAEKDKAVAMAQLAQAQFFANDRKLDRATESLLEEVLKINPQETTALGLLGVSAYDKGEYLRAIGHWQQLIDLMPVNNPNRSAIMNGIARAKSQLSQEQLNQFNALEKQNKLAKKQALKAQGKASIEVTVSVDAAILAQLPESADLFVMAKAKNGPPMPLAVQRLQVAKTQWPVQVTLDDTMAMMADLQLSNFDQVVITARISKSGVGNAKAGDLQGMSQALPVSVEDVSVSIDHLVK